MPKRYTDTEKWKDDWFLSLDNDKRIIWLFILDNCSSAGIFKKNFKMLNFICNTNIDEREFLEIFEGRVVDINGYFFITKFLKFQYPKGLTSLKPIVISIRNELKEKGLTGLVKELLGSDYAMIEQSLPNDNTIIKQSLDNDYSKSKSKSKGKGKDSFPDKKEKQSNELFEISELQKNSDTGKLFLWIENESIQVKKMSAKMTFEQLENLTKKHGFVKVQNILESMDNYKPLLKNYQSASLTANKWCLKENNNGESRKTFNGTAKRKFDVNPNATYAETEF
jgi:hypothetical protein